jgi:stalled ribosome rescue protein Dom34
MSHYAVWIDHKHAFIYKFDATGTTETMLEGKGEVKHDDKFFHQVASKLTGAKELLIMGPGEAKSEFKHHLENHNHKELAKSVVGVKPMKSHPTKALMLDNAKEFFKHHHMFTKNY